LDHDPWGSDARAQTAGHLIAAEAEIRAITESESLVRENRAHGDGGMATFELATGKPPGEYDFALQGPTLRLVDAAT